MVDWLFPSENDVGSRGLGIKAAAESIARLVRAPWYSEPTPRVRRNFVLSGLAATDGGGLNASISAGTAMVVGYVYDNDSADSVSVNASETNQNWYLQLVRTAGRVSGSQWVRVIDPAEDGSDDPDESVRIFSCTTDGSGITSGPTDQRKRLRGPRYGTYTGNASSTQDIALGFRPVLVIIHGDNGVRGQIFSISTIRRTGNTQIGAWVDDAAGGATTGRIRRAELTVTGFTVESDGTNDSLNEVSRVYNYIAWPL
jgi:hypothetical protein